jgi:hypothetical protein
MPSVATTSIAVMNPYQSITEKSRSSDPTLPRRDIQVSLAGSFTVIRNLQATPQLLYYALLNSLSFYVALIDLGILVVISPEYHPGEPRDHWLVRHYRMPSLTGLSQERSRLWIARRDAVVSYGATSEGFVPRTSTILFGLSLERVREDFLMTPEAILKLENGRHGVGRVWRAPEGFCLVNFFLVDHLPNYALIRSASSPTIHQLVDLQKDVSTPLVLCSPFHLELTPDGKTFWMVQNSIDQKELGILYPEGFLPKMSLPRFDFTSFRLVDSSFAIIGFTESSHSGFLLVDLDSFKISGTMLLHSPIKTGRVEVYPVVAGSCLL